MSFDSNQSSSSFCHRGVPYRDSSSVEYKLSLLSAGQDKWRFGFTVPQIYVTIPTSPRCCHASCPTSASHRTSASLGLPLNQLQFGGRSCDSCLEFRTRVLTTIFLNTFLSETSTLVGGSLMTTLLGHSFHTLSFFNVLSFTEQSLSPWTSHISPLGV